MASQMISTWMEKKLTKEEEQKAKAADTQEACQPGTQKRKLVEDGSHSKSLPHPMWNFANASLYCNAYRAALDQICGIFQPDSAATIH